MNIKKLTYITVFALGFQTLNSCKNELEVEPKGSSLESNYYRNEQEAYNGLVAAYDPIGWEFGSTYGNKVGPLNIPDLTPTVINEVYLPFRTSRLKRHPRLRSSLI